LTEVEGAAERGGRMGGGREGTVKSCNFVRVLQNF
jgi:hypothetical protein